MSKLKRELLRTQDGSLTIHLPEWNESYHSKHGAIQEACHVFIKNGLDFFVHQKEVNILEIGFGTGLNAFITLLESQNRNQKINYTAVDAFPIEAEIYEKLNFHELLQAVGKQNLFLALHQSPWEQKQEIISSFSLVKNKIRFEEISSENQFDLIYFDAFGFRVQPELWSVEIFQTMYKALKNEGMLTTYAARGIITNNLKKSGFQVKKTNGPIGKREMTIAVKKA